MDSLEIIRGENRQTVDRLIESFVQGKCVRKIDRFNHKSDLYSSPLYEAYVYYRLSSPPIFSDVVATVDGSDIIITGTLSSPEWLFLTEIGVLYSVTGDPTKNSPYELIIPVKYGNFSVTLTDITASLIYLKFWTNTCLGKTYSEVVTIQTIDYLQDTYEEYIQDTYGEYIWDTYQ